MSWEDCAYSIFKIVIMVLVWLVILRVFGIAITKLVSEEENTEVVVESTEEVVTEEPVTEIAFTDFVTSHEAKCLALAASVIAFIAAFVSRYTEREHVAEQYLEKRDRLLNDNTQIKAL